MACYGDSFASVYVDDVHTSKETSTLPWPVTGIALLLYMYMMFIPHRKHYTSMPCYGDSFASVYVYDVRTSQETSTLPWPVTGIALLLYMYMMFVPHRKLLDFHGLLQG
jgi:inner membrane protein involved in colicin E2 resistance